MRYNILDIIVISGLDFIILVLSRNKYLQKKTFKTILPKGVFTVPLNE